MNDHPPARDNDRFNANAEKPLTFSLSLSLSLSFSLRKELIELVT